MSKTFWLVFMTIAGPAVIVLGLAVHAHEKDTVVIPVECYSVGTEERVCMMNESDLRQLLRDNKFLLDKHREKDGRCGKFLES